jgi:hypothetical protein
MSKKKPEPTPPPPTEATPAGPLEDVRKWKVSHNNCPEVIVAAKDEDEARAKGLERLGVAKTTKHPVRVWPAREEE